MITSFTPPKPFQGFNPVVPPAPIQQNSLPAEPSETQLPRVIQFGADLSGCGLYRLGWVSHLLNYQGSMMVTDTTVMVLDPRWYVNTKAIRLQRQATSAQLEFVKFLKEIQKQVGFKIIYEVDDVVFREDIPDYNKFKTAFTSY